MNGTLLPISDSFSLTSTQIKTTGEAPLFHFSQSFVVNSQMYVLPCRTTIYEEYDDVESAYLENIFIFDLNNYEWKTMTTKGDIPSYFPLNMSVLKNKIYCFSHQFDSIYTLDLGIKFTLLYNKFILETCEWKLEKVEGELPIVCHQGRRGYSLTSKEYALH